MLRLEDEIVVFAWPQAARDFATRGPEAMLEDLAEVRAPASEIVIDVDDRDPRPTRAPLQCPDGLGRRLRARKHFLGAFEVERIDHVDDEQRDSAFVGGV